MRCGNSFVKNSHLVAENIASIIEYRERIAAIKKTVSWLKFSDPKLAEELLGYVPEIAECILRLDIEIKNARR